MTSFAKVFVLLQILMRLSVGVSSAFDPPEICGNTDFCRLTWKRDYYEVWKDDSKEVCCFPVKFPAPRASSPCGLDPKGTAVSLFEFPGSRIQNLEDHIELNDTLGYYRSLSQTGGRRQHESSYMLFPLPYGSFVWKSSISNVYTKYTPTCLTSQKYNTDLHTKEQPLPMHAALEQKSTRIFFVRVQPQKNEVPVVKFRKPEGTGKYDLYAVTALDNKPESVKHYNQSGMQARTEVRGKIAGKAMFIILFAQDTIDPKNFDFSGNSESRD